MAPLAANTRLVALVTCMAATAGAIVLVGCGGGNKAGGGAPPKKIVLAMASAISNGQPDQLERFADEVATRSGGSLQIDFRPDWRARDLHQERDTIRDVRNGKADLAWVGARAWDSVGVTEFDALLAPFLVDSYALERDVFARGIPERMLEGVARAGVVGIGVLPGPLRKILGIRRRFVRPSDFRGQVVGVSGVVAADTIEAFRGRPRQVFAQTSLSGLDALEQQVGSIANRAYDGNARYLTSNVNLWPRPLVIFAAPKVFDSLTTSQQEVLREASAAAVEEGLAASRREDADGFDVLCRRGTLTFVLAAPAERAALRRAVEPVYRRLKGDAPTLTFLREIHALKRTAKAEPAAAGCGAGPVPPRHRGSTVIDGSWEMEVSADYLIRHHPKYLPPPPPEALRLDSGWYRFTFRKGRVSAWHRAPAIRTHSTGEFAVDGDTVVFRYTGGHEAGAAPTRYRWSLYRGALTFRPLGGAQAEPGLAPWHRVDR
jgi:TRAP-type C4-dicarboxylate transport system substrate-binding protein